jgi:HK97 gp10 family phage protein
MPVTLTSDLGDIASGIPDEVKDAIKEATEEMADRARANVPVDTGDLRESIEVVEYNEPGFVGYRVVADARAEPVRGRSDGAPYAHMVEYGSVHNMPAKPFLIPALYEGRDATLDAVSDALKKAGDR